MTTSHPYLQQNIENEQQQSSSQSSSQQQSSSQTINNNISNRNEDMSQQIQLMILFQQSSQSQQQQQLQSQPQQQQLQSQQQQPQHQYSFSSSCQQQWLSYESQYKDKLVLGKLVICLKTLYYNQSPSYKWSNIQKTKFVEKLLKLSKSQSSKSQSYCSQNSFELLSLVTKMNGLQFVREYSIFSFSLYEYSESIQSVQKNENQYVKFTKLPQQITTVYLSNLHYLYLSHNQIDNIQSLSFVNAPCLIHITLNNNKIVNLNPFQKCHFPQLLFLSLEQNLITVIQNIYRANFMTLTIQPKHQCYSVEQFMSLDACFTIKFEKISVEKLRCLYVNDFYFNTNPYLKRLLRF